MNKKPHRVILDVDTATGSAGGEHDDALAILLALNSPEVILEGVTTGPSNVDTRTATINSLRILETAGRSDVPVAEGRFDTLLGDGAYLRQFYDRRANRPHVAVYWKDWVAPPMPKLKPAKVKAWDLISSKVREHPGEVSLVFVGSLINLAMAVLTDPEIIPMIRQVVHMGGFSDFSYFERIPDRPVNGWLNTDYDPFASAIVYRSGVRFVQLSADVTQRTTITVEEFQRIVDEGGPAASFIASTAIPWTKYYQDKRGFNGSCPHDPLAVAFVIDPTLVKTRKMHVHLEKLMAGRFGYFEEAGSGPEIDFATEVDVPRFKAMLMERYLRR